MFRGNLLNALFGLGVIITSITPAVQGAETETGKKPGLLTFATVHEAQTDPDFKLQGEYLTEDPAAPRRGVQLVALGDHLYRVVILPGGLPGDGWNGTAPQIMEEEEGEVIQDLLTGWKARKIERKSSTLEAAPPAGAEVLFDGTPESLTKNWKPGARLSEQGLLRAGATTLKNYQDYRLHVEFQTPFMPTARGQARGNSGIYHQARYETQILDSFGLDGLDNETGGIYTIRKPDVNACYPPLSWQTYDVDFTAARYDGSGKKITDARMTVRLNGVIVQRDVLVPTATRSAPLEEGPSPGPIYLQDHGNPVHFRNIWIVPRDADQEARRPQIAGFERFHGLSEPSVDGGMLLLGELGCINCHSPKNEEFRKALQSKQAPVLTEVGNRVRPQWIVDFLSDPHSVKPGTTMPDVLGPLPAEERKQAALALASFLSTTGSLRDQNPNEKQAAAGEQHFRSVGCVACHEQNPHAQTTTGTSVPLGNLAAKYSVPSLALFLKEPHKSRPSSRMPSLNLDNTQAEQIANYLLKTGKDVLPPNVKYQVFEGRWFEMPNFDDLKPVKEGTCVGFDRSVAGKESNFGIRFEAYLPDIYKSAHIFGLAADDGARLWLDGDLVLETKGAAAGELVERTARFEPNPVHHIRVDYYQARDGQELVVMLGRQGAPLEHLGPQLHLTPEATEASVSDKPQTQIHRFTTTPELIAQGRELFSSLGCAKCHALKIENQELKSPLKSPGLEHLNPMKGCLAADESRPSAAGVAHYDLTDLQTQNIVLALKAAETLGTPTAESQIRHTMTALNCYACHQRGGIGGPEVSKNDLFKSTQPEMGDEGRLPPPLDGVGDKLQEKWLGQVMSAGAKNRPYMQTRMPAFAQRNVSHLVPAFVKEDQQTLTSLAKTDEPLPRVKSTGRQLVGNGGLGCIKCHTFAGKAASGIQAVALTGMTSRIREDWFLRYVYDPQKYRPGTRMPTGFPNGEAIVKDVYHGDANQQISAIWTYLLDGDKAGLPEGLVAKMIELKPEQEPIIYRNFIAGVSPRAIAVGYPEKANLAFDADELCLKLIWHDRFLDAAMHWAGRGTGHQSPLGDHIATLESVLPFAPLTNPEEPWPTASIRQQPNHQFLGYQLDELGRPTFRYRIPFGLISDKPVPINRNDHEGIIRREIQFTPEGKPGPLYFRAASGKAIEKTDQGYRVDGLLTVRIQGGKPFLRKSGEQMELLVPVDTAQPVQLIQEIDW